MAEDFRRGRLSLRPVDPSPGVPPASYGPTRLELSAGGSAWLRAPVGSPAVEAAPLLVVLHGAGGRAESMLYALSEPADRYGLLLLAPQSRGASWDVIRGGSGADVQLLDEALRLVMGRQRVDRARLAVGGFSDGASYALSLGIANGDVFGHVLAWSPGFSAPAVVNGAPRLFLSHGIRDQVLPVDRCSRRLVPALRAAGYDVRYDEFDGPHVMPPAVVEDSLRWFLGADLPLADPER